MHGHRVTFLADRQLMPDVPQLAECSVANAEVLSEILDGVYAVRALFVGFRACLPYLRGALFFLSWVSY